jgi:hypothetical protein
MDIEKWYKNNDIIEDDRDYDIELKDLNLES